MYSSLRRTETCLETGNSEAKAAADSILLDWSKIILVRLPKHISVLPELFRVLLNLFFTFQFG